jgi:hypothetical protein
MNSKFLKQKYSEWCKETRRNGAVLVGGSIDDFFEWLDESCPPPVSAEVVSQLFLYDNISPDFIPIDNLEEAKKYVEANYTEDDGIHPDFHSFPIYKKVGSVDADINGEDICTSITVSSSSPSAPVVAEQVVTLLELDPGELFEFDGTIALKSEYRTEKGAVESYIVGSGEMFWGGTDTAEALNNLLVKRISLHSPAERIEESDAVDFGEWILSEKIISRDTNWFDAGKHHTTKELYQAFKKQTNNHE